MTRIDEFIENEKASDRFFSNPPSITSTADRRYASIRTEPYRERIIRPSWLVGIAGVLFLGFYLFIYYSLIRTLPNLGAIMGILVVTVMVFLIIRQIIHGSNPFCTLRLNKEFIEHGKQIIPWSTIEGTYIMRKSNSKKYSDYLVIDKKEGGVEKFEITFLGITTRKLALYIEQCKHASSQ